MPESLKERAEEQAGREGLSVNAWMVRAVQTAVHPTASHAPRPAPHHRLRPQLIAPTHPKEPPCPPRAHRFPTDGPVHLHLRSSRGTVEVIADDVPETARRRRPAATTSASCACRRSDDGRQVTVEVPRSWRPGGPPRFDITVRLPQRLHGRPRPPHRRASPRAGVLAKAEAKTASGAVSIEQVEGDCHADVRQRRHRSSARSAAPSTSRARRATCASRGSAAAARRRTASGAIDIGWAGDLVSAVSASRATSPCATRRAAR